ncbi:hypothetical protein C8R43DRAFT_328872 [Mycena crocata]|nr:hypothetical protein C8R43DRAFT_328872 [Mycena crocata]
MHTEIKFQPHASSQIKPRTAPPSFQTVESTNPGASHPLSPTLTHSAVSIHWRLLYFPIGIGIPLRNPSRFSLLVYNSWLIISGASRYTKAPKAQAVERESSHWLESNLEWAPLIYPSIPLHLSSESTLSPSTHFIPYHTSSSCTPNSNAPRTPYHLRKDSEQPHRTHISQIHAHRLGGNSRHLVGPPDPDPDLHSAVSYQIHLVAVHCCDILDCRSNERRDIQTPLLWRHERT